jgi:hypothetical protein
MFFSQIFFRGNGKFRNKIEIKMEMINGKLEISGNLKKGENEKKGTRKKKNKKLIIRKSEIIINSTK